VLKHGADVNFPDQQGNTALLAAARQGHREIVSMLLRFVELADSRARSNLGTSLS
jgi:ankyrin repeat protein